MKVVSTVSLSRPEAFKKLKKFYEIDKKRSSKNSNGASLSQPHKSQLKGIVKSIKLVQEHIKKHLK
jgi:hypothetical protein